MGKDLLTCDAIMRGLPGEGGCIAMVADRRSGLPGLAATINSVTEFGGLQEFTTWDGEPISRERPYGATIVVASRTPDGWRYLLLHRAHHGPDYDGDWAWTPPSGSRKPGEEVIACAIRELREETGLRERPQPVAASNVDWAVFALEIPWGTPIAVDGTEHDRLEWVSYAEARMRCTPAVLAASFTTACTASGFE